MHNLFLCTTFTFWHLTMSFSDKCEKCTHENIPKLHNKNKILSMSLFYCLYRLSLSKNSLHGCDALTIIAF